MSAIHIRLATGDDAKLIADFNQRMALETESRSLDGATVNRGVQRLIERPENGHYRLAVRDGQVVGSLMITFEWSDWRDGNMWWIQSVYVTPESRRTGVFSALYKDVIDAASSDPDVRCVRLYVEHENTGAQATYSALGMHETGYRLFEVGV